MPAHDGKQNLADRTAVVTGAGGVGSMVAELLAARGARVAVWDRDPEALRTCIDKMSGRVGEDFASGVVIDVRDSVAVRQAAETAVNWAGGVHILAMCHGILRTARLLKLAEQDWDHVIDTNAKGRFLAAQGIAREMIRAGTGGVIIDVGSFTGKRIAVGRLHYCVGNAVAEAMTKAMAVDLGTYGIRVFSINSGPIDTPLLGDRAREPDRMARFLEKIPLRRLGTPSDVAEAVAFLASDEASYWSGGTLPLDGGWMAG